MIRRENLSHFFAPPPRHVRQKNSAVLMGGRAEGQACTHPGVRTPIGASGIFWLVHIFVSLPPLKNNTVLNCNPPSSPHSLDDDKICADAWLRVSKYFVALSLCITVQTSADTFWLDSRTQIWLILVSNNFKGMTGSVTEIMFSLTLGKLPKTYLGGGGGPSISRP